MRAWLRRPGIVVLALGLVTAGSSLAGGASAQVVPEPTPPNILLIVTDDQRVGTLNVMDQTIQRLEAQGRTYSDAYATTPVCCPARASILTGQYSHNHGVRRNEDADKLDSESTMQFWLKQTGYHTGIFGKYLNGWTGAPPYFDRWAIHGQKPRYYDNVWNVDGTPTTISEHETDYISQEAVEYIAERETLDAQPWFLYLTPYAPHQPSTPPTRYRSTPVGAFEGNPAVYEEDLSDKPPYVQSREPDLARAAKIRRRQLRSLMGVDDLVAAVDDALAEHGEGNTLVFFVSDNGYSWHEHRLYGSAGGKSTPYEFAVRVPLLFRWPQEVAAKSLDRRLVGIIDIAPTVYEAAKIDAVVTTEVDGRSLLDPTWSRSELLIEKTDTVKVVPGWSSLRKRSMVYTEYQATHEHPEFFEFYDLVEDPWELENLLHNGDETDDPSGISRLSERLSELQTCAGTSGGNPCP